MNLDFEDFVHKSQFVASAVVNNSISLAERDMLLLHECLDFITNNFSIYQKSDNGDILPDIKKLKLKIKKKCKVQQPDFTRINRKRLIRELYEIYNSIPFSPVEGENFSFAK